MSLFIATSVGFEAELRICNQAQLFRKKVSVSSNISLSSKFTS